MGKQTMGTPGTALKYRTDNKTYRLQTGQTPVVRPPLYNEYGLDNFPNGTNAVVAVISYTGYDMDDAMILNKSAHERGFGHGTIYKTKKIDLVGESRQGRSRSTVATHMFGFAPNSLIKASWRTTLDDDGFAAVGTKVKEGDIIAASYTVTKDAMSGEYENHDGITHLHRYKDSEEAFVEEIKLIGTSTCFSNDRDNLSGLDTVTIRSDFSTMSEILLTFLPTDHRQRVWKQRAMSGHQHTLSTAALACHRRQVLVTAWPEGCLLPKVASDRHAIHRVWHAARHYNKHSRLPFSYDDRYVHRIARGQVGCFAWSRSGLHAFQVQGQSG